jgi:beta-N-acetylhexosaminidase
MLSLRARPLAILALLTTAALAGGVAGFAAGRHGPRSARVARTSQTVSIHARASTRHEGIAHRRVSLRRLSLAQLAGQRIIYAYTGLTPSLSLMARIRAGEAAGVIFFEPNISSPAQLRSVIARLQAANASAPVHAPLLMLIDQEGGLVRRLPGAPELSEKQIGEDADPVAAAREAGHSAGEQLASVGINVNLAPVLDVFRRPGDFIDEFQRSYGMDAHTVASLGGLFISAQQRMGVAATAKHFPGLGAAEREQNTDERPVTLNLSLHELRSIDEVPYHTAIAAGVPLVMLSWAIYPAIDPGVPAGLSSKMIEDELRGRLGFRGVTITDGLAAGSLHRFGTPARRGIRAARAGADLLLCSALTASENTPAEGVTVLNGLARALASGRLNRMSAEQAAQRVISLRTRLTVAR